MLISTCDVAVTVRFIDGETDEEKTVTAAIGPSGRTQIALGVKDDKLREVVYFFTDSELKAIIAASALLEV